MKVKHPWLVLASLVAVAATTAALVAVSTGGASSGKASGSITVWVDAVRLPVAKLYIKTHPNVKMNIVTYDGDGNGATTMQTKIQLWNRTGKGWPDVVFSQQVNDPVWMGQSRSSSPAPQGPHSRRRSSRAGPHRRPRSARSTAASSACRTTSPRKCSGSTRS